MVEVLGVQKIGCRVRISRMKSWFLLAMAVLATLTVGSTQKALASAGCTFVNNGGLNLGLGVPPGDPRVDDYFSINGPGVSYPFAIGDIVTFNLTVTGSPGNPSFKLLSGNSTLLLSINSTSTQSYTVTGANNDVIQTNEEHAPPGAVISGTATCVPIAGPPPTITSLSPSSGSLVGGTSVTITGTNLSGVTAVKFGSTAAASFTVDSATRITAISPTGKGVVDVTVSTTTDTSATNPADQFTYSDKPPDSRKLRQLQTSITKSIAATSGQILSDAIAAGIADGFSDDGTPSNFGPSGVFINFATMESQSGTASHVVNEAFAALGYAGDVYKAPILKAQPRAERTWSAWADFRGTGWKINDTTGNSLDQKGNQFNVTAGLGRRLTHDMLVGVIVGYEYFKYDVAALAGTLKGDGETLGVYFAQRFGGNLRFDAALAWSHLSYNATAGTATGSFIGNRWLASTGLTGNHKLGSYVLEPSVKIYVLLERENEWTDSLGTVQDARSFTAGRTAVGTKVSHPFDAENGWKILPYVGFYGDWRFQTDTALPTGDPLVANVGSGWSGRVTSGISATSADGNMVSLNGEYGGLGADYKVWTGSVRCTLRF